MSFTRSSRLLQAGNLGELEQFNPTCPDGRAPNWLLSPAFSSLPDYCRSISHQSVRRFAAQFTKFARSCWYMAHSKYAGFGVWAKSHMFGRLCSTLCAVCLLLSSRLPTLSSSLTGPEF